MVSLEDAKKYVRIDFTDDDTLISELIDVAQIYIDSLVGEEYKADEKLVKIADLLIKKLVNDMYENNSFTVTSSAKKDIIINSMLDKLAIRNWSEENGEST